MKKQQSFQTHDIENKETEILRQTRGDKKDKDKKTEEESVNIPTNLPKAQNSSIAPQKRNLKIRNIVGVIFLSLIMLAIGYLLGTTTLGHLNSLGKNGNQNTSNEETPSKENAAIEKSFTGVPVSIVIDNHPDALPQKGLKDASIIWEALAEGGITRLLAVYTTENPQLAGPVRSARTYFNTIANQYGGLYLHSGGAPDALRELSSKTFSFTDVNEFFFGSTFFRDAKRKSPHNLFTTSQQIEQLITSKKIPERTVTLYQSSLQPQNGSLREKLTIPFAPTTIVEFSWIEGKGWKKTVNGREWTDETGTPLVFDSVVVLSIEDLLIPHPSDPDFRKYVFTNGEARLLRDHKEIQGAWSADEEGLLKFRYLNNDPLYLKEGKILFVLVPKRINITSGETLD